MFILRNVVQEDLEDLFELSSKVKFINLPNNKEIIQQKITSSLNAFNDPSGDLSKNYYIFVLEDIAKNKVIGASMIHAQHGTKDSPHFFLKVGLEKLYSKTINTGFDHGTLKLGIDSDGPTEIGGLVVSPEYRGNKDKLGKQISFIRFLYLGLNPGRFRPVVHSELMPPFDENGKSPLWEALGRRFLNMEYDEADVLSRSNKEFILSLFPSNNIYMTLLPMSARNAIGKVGPDTQGVKKMLKSIGFKYTNEVDPFDGGPHYRCKLQDISVIQNLKSYQYSTEDIHGTEQTVLLQIQSKKYDFYVRKVTISCDDQLKSFSLLDKKIELIEGEHYSFIGF